MIVWDRGSWAPLGDPETDYRKGTLKFRLNGEKLGGGWTLVRLKPKEGERGDNWLLIKEHDPYARSGEGDQLLEERPESVLSGRRVEELLADEKPGLPAPASPRRARRIRPSVLPGAVKAAAARAGPAAARDAGCARPRGRRVAARDQARRLSDARPPGGRCGAPA